MRSRNVCIVTLDSPYLHREDGVASYTYFLSTNLAKLGCEVHVLGLGSNLREKQVFHQNGVIFSCLPTSRVEPIRTPLFLKKMALPRIQKNTRLM